VLFLPFPIFREVESRMDPVTGSIMWKTTWIFGITDSSRADVSPLERRLIRSGIVWTRSSHLLHITSRDLFGNAIGYACGSSPPIYSMQGLLGDFADASTDDELREFVRVMEFGSEDEQESAVRAA